MAVIMGIVRRQLSNADNWIQPRRSATGRNLRCPVVAEQRHLAVLRFNPLRLFDWGKSGYVRSLNARV